LGDGDRQACSPGPRPEEKVTYLFDKDYPKFYFKREK
jgi:hypothetical protein